MSKHSPRTTEEIAADYARRCHEREEHEAEYNRLIADLQKSVLVPVTCHWGKYDRAMIASVQVMDDRATVTRWDHNGPMGHTIVSPLHFWYELLAFAFDTPPSTSAAEQLDAWALAGKFEILDCRR